MLPDAASPDARIADEHVHCRACGYALRALDPSGTCPECGVDVAGSLTIALSDDPWWRRDIRIGAVLMATALALAGVARLVFTWSVILEMENFNVPLTAAWTMLCAAGLAGLLAVPGVWFATLAEDCRADADTDTRRQRRVARAGIASGLGALLFAVAVFIFVPTISHVPRWWVMLHRIMDLLPPLLVPLLLSVGLRALARQWADWLDRTAEARLAGLFRDVGGVMRLAWWTHLLALTALGLSLAAERLTGYGVVVAAVFAPLFLIDVLALTGAWVAAAALAVLLVVAARRLRVG